MCKSGLSVCSIHAGRPEVPGNLRLVTSQSNPTHLMWERPTNIPTGVSVSYRVTINSSTSLLGAIFTLVDVKQLSIEFLEMELADAEICKVFMFSVVASAADVDDSEAAVIMDTVPLCEIKILILATVTAFL